MKYDGIIIKSHCRIAAHERTHTQFLSKNYGFDSEASSGPDFHRDKLQLESSLFKSFWMPDLVWHDGQTDHINRRYLNDGRQG